MTIKEFADGLTGRSLDFGISNIEAQRAKELGFVIVFGASDDLIEFEGAIRDEEYCSNGTVIYLTADGLFEPKKYCPRHDGDVFVCECEFIKQKQDLCKTITVHWCGESGFTWAYETDIPHETFELYDEEEKYCRGIVFDISSLK